MLPISIELDNDEFDLYPSRFDKFFIVIYVALLNQILTHKIRDYNLKPFRYSLQKMNAFSGSRVRPYQPGISA